MHQSGDNRYSDVISSRNTPGGPCISYRPYVGPDGKFVYVLQVGILRKTAGDEWKGLEKKLERGKIPLARPATKEEEQRLSKMNILKLPAELADIVNAALSQKKTATTAVS